MSELKVNVAERPVAASELVKNLEHEIRMELEFYFEDKGLRDTVENHENNQVPIETILNMDKMKKLGVTREILLHAISDSEVLEINGSGTAIKQSPRDDHKEDFEPAKVKKVKTENGGVVSYKSRGNFETKIFKITLSEKSNKLRAVEIKRLLEKQLDIKVVYLRLHGNEGYFAVDPTLLSEEKKKMLAKVTADINGDVAKIQECANEDLDAFFAKHGRHLDYHLGRLGRRTGLRDTQDEVDLIFYNPKYLDAAPLKYIFDAILLKHKAGEVIPPADSTLLQELLTYHDQGVALAANCSHFTTGVNKNQGSMKTFLAVKKDGSTMPFTFEECMNNLMEKFSIFKDQE